MGKIARFLVSLLVVGAAGEVLAAPQTYYLLAPESFSGDIKVVSLEPGNTITVGNYALTLDQYQRAAIPNTALYSGAAVSGTKAFSLGSDVDATDLLVPAQFAGTSFVIPQAVGQHRYYLMTTAAGGATATVTVGTVVSTIPLSPNIVVQVDGGSNNALAARITATANILVAHVGVVSGVVRDAFPVPPAASTVVGIRSQNVMLAAVADSTSGTVYASDGTSMNFSLNAGQEVLVTAGLNTAQGQGSALRIDASSPVMAIQYDDGDGNDATAFWPTSLHTSRNAIPVDTQYIAVACTSASVNVTLYRGAVSPDSQTCSGSATYPGKVYFGSAANGANIPASSYVISSADVYLIHEAATTDDEHNLLGATLPAGPSAPTLTAPPSSTTSNPLIISGTAAANAPIRLFVNNRLAATGTASSGGAFSINTPLLDGANVIYATALTGTNESVPSNAVSTTYSNGISRTQSGTISVDTVWTPGSPATPYVISANLTVAAGAQLTIQPGTTLKFANNVVLAANGTLVINGELGNPVTLTCNSGTCTKGIWNGIDVVTATSNVSINYATIDWAVMGVEVSGGGVATIRNSTIRNFSQTGVWMGGGASSSLIQNNLIDNLNKTGDCIGLSSASPTVSGNTLQNCQNGIDVFSNSNPTVNGNNLITSNQYGIWATGNYTGNPQPVVTGNRLYGNSSYDFYTTSYTAATNMVLNATGNWWGTTDLTAISNKIYDLTDNYTATATYPTVNFASPLDGPTGSPIAGNYLAGPLSASSTTLTAGAIYQVIGTVFVPATKSLTVPAGTQLRFQGSNTQLVVDGTLTVQGVSGNQAVFTSGRSTPARGDWPGIRFRANGSVVDGALIEWAAMAVNGNNVSATVKNSIVRNFSTTGVWFGSAGASASLIQNNLIDNLNKTGDCIGLDTTSPTVTGNTIQNCQNGIDVFSNSNPTVNGNNLITSNQYGIWANGNYTGNPQPVVTGNQLYGNSYYDFYTQSYTAATNIVLNATGNWWGTTDLTAISNKIYDVTDKYTLPTNYPTVNFASPLDGPTGSPIPGNYLSGPLSATSTTLTAGAIYQVIGTVFVPASKSLMVPAGTQLRFQGYNTQLVVDGTLTVQGVIGNQAVFTSGRSTPARGDWPGILLRANGSVIDNAVIEWAYLSVNDPGFTVTVSNSTIRNFSGDGVYLKGAGAAGSLIQNNLIDNLNRTGDCIGLDSTSPTITGNTIQNCTNGIDVYATAAPTVNGNNLITSNQYGIMANGNYTGNPQPVVTGNRLYGNSSYDFYTMSYAAATNIVVNATGNWWGTTNLTAISNKIYDVTDNYAAPATYPTVNFASPLDGPTGSPIAGNYLLGPLSASSTTLTSGAIYQVIGTVFVPATKSLTIPAGTQLRFLTTSTQLVVDGTLSVQGTSGSPVVFTSGQPTPARGDWPGILVRANGSVIDNALIEWAYLSVNDPGFTVTVSNSTIRNFSGDGVYLKGSGASGSLIQNNLIDNLNMTGDCIGLDTASPTVTGNTIQNCQNGIDVFSNSNPTVNGNNLITSNQYGILANGNYTGNPQPVVTGNRLYGNSYYDFCTQNYGAATNIVLNATGNWWGTTDLTAISNKIYDVTDNYTAPASYPTVNFANPLDGPTGSPIPGNYISGPLSATSTTLTAGANYQVIGTVFVPAAKSLIIPAGTQLRFYNSTSRLVVDGSLSIQGTASARVLLTSGRAFQANADWPGILIRSTATAVTIDNAVIEYTDTAVDVVTTNAIVKNSVIRQFQSNGIRMSSSSSASQISNNYLDNATRIGNCIYLSASSPSITGNRIQRCDIGIYMAGASNPATTGNVIQDNNRGIYLNGGSSNSASAVPNPVMTGNDIFGNTTSQLEVANYGASNPVVINATGNWWGTATPVAGQQIKFTGGSPTTSVNFSGAASGPLNGAISGAVTVSEPYFSPNADGIKDTTLIQSTLSQSASWTLNIRGASGAVLQTYSGSGTAVSATWDGRNAASQLQPDGIYNIELTVPGAPNPLTIGQQAVGLDVTPPTVAISSPSSGAVLANVFTVPVSGTAGDTNLVNYVLEYGAGSAPSSWTQIATQTTSIQNSALGTWTVNSIDGSANVYGLQTLRVRAADRAGNTASLSNSVTIDNLTAAAITQNVALIRPVQGDQLTVSFATTLPVTGILDIYPDLGGALVRSISQTFSTSGAKTLSWDGRDAANNYVPDEAYRWVLTLTDGSRTTIYDPPDTSSVGYVSGSVDASFNVHANDFFKMNLNMVDAKARVRMQVTGCVSGTIYPYNWVPFVGGVIPIMWDGRDAAGNPAVGSCSVYFDPPDPLRPFSVIVKGTAPAITGTRASPNLEVDGQPYVAFHSYDQVGRFTYRLSLDSTVTVKLLPPGVGDFNDPSAIVLTNAVTQPASSGGTPIDYTVEWKGNDGVDTNNILVSTEGTYTIAIQATSTATGRTTIYRGALQLYR